MYAIRSYYGNLKAFAALTAGLVAGLAIGKITEIYTSGDYRFVIV